MINPIFTEKTIKMAKSGKYTFGVVSGVTKPALKSEIGKQFSVHVKSIRVTKTGPEVKRNNKGMNILKLATKKVIVTLKDGQKIDLFEEKKKK